MLIKDLHEIASIMGVKGDFSGIVRGFCVDSRKAEEGMLFFALKGEKTDGHQFLEDVAKKGVMAAVVSFDYHGPDYGLPLLRLTDALAGLQELAREVIRRRSFTIIAVTGSMGKTTTKEFISALLETKYRLAKTAGNANSQIGLPLSILSLSGEEEVLVIEMAMSERHQIERLVSIAPPDIAVVTKIAMAHIDLFSGLEGIAEAKAEILSHPKTRFGILSTQAASYDVIRNMGPSEKITYGRDGDYWLEKKEGKYVIEGKEKSPSIELLIQGEHIIENFLPAAIIARKFDISWEEIVKKARDLKPHERRFEVFERNGVTFVNDCYNANPDSMRAAIENIPKLATTRRKIAVLGEMAGLAGYSESCHREIGAKGALIFDELICMGKATKYIVEEFEKVGKKGTFCDNIDLLKQKMKEVVQQQDLVLVKGSNGNQLWKVFEENFF